MAATITSSPLADGNRPKRVILRLRVNQCEGEGRSWEQHVDAIQASLIWAGRPTSEYHEGSYETRKHFAYLEPLQDPSLQQTTFHVVLDMEQDMLNAPNFVRRNKGGKLYHKMTPLFKQIGLLSAEKSCQTKASLRSFDGRGHFSPEFISPVAVPTA